MKTILRKNAWLLLVVALTIALVRLIRTFHGIGIWELLLDVACGGLFFLAAIVLFGRKRISI